MAPLSQPNVLYDREVMLDSFRRLSSQDLGGPIRSFIFFILFYLYLWLDVDPRLIYHGGGVIEDFPVFFRGWAFFQKFISYPGGPVEYLSAFLSQFLYYSWAGTLVLTLLAWLICMCAGAFIKALDGPCLGWVRFIPPILLLIVYSQYAYHFVTTVALLAALLSVCLYLRITPNSKLPHLVVFLVLSVILYYIAGGAYLLFAALCAIYELLFRRCWRMGLLCLLLAAVIPYVEGVIIFGVSIIDAFSELLPFSWKILFNEAHRRMVMIIYILYLLLPLTALGWGFWRVFVPNFATKSQNGNPFRWLIESLVLFLVAGAAVFFSHDNELKTLFAVDYYAYHKMWPEVLQIARRCPNTYFVVHAVNRALYHTGRLGYEMLSYPQNPGTLFLMAKGGTSVHWKKFDTFIDLGYLNIAEHSLTESMEDLGERPMILKRLALINMVKGDIGAARIYLGALGKTLFYVDWANSYLDRLESHPSLSTDEQIQQLRCMMVEKDYALRKYSPEIFLLELLEKNSQNRMAFEYLMAWYMLNGQLDSFVQNLDRLDDFDYSEIPRLYEEAILVYQLKTGREIDLKGRQISGNTYQRAHHFTDIVRNFSRDNKKGAMLATAKDFADSYFFYYNFGALTVTK